MTFHEFWGEATETNRVSCEIYEKTVLAHEFSGDIQYFGSQASNCTSVAPSLLISSGTILAWGGTIFVWGGTAL